MEKIEKVWFENGKIFILTTTKRELSQPLEFFPILKDATETQREAFTINKWGDAIRWVEIDEDIHISSFYEQVDVKTNNSVGELFAMFPQLNISEVAKSIGIHKSLLSQYIYGVKTPSDKRMSEIKSALHALGMRLISASA